MRLFIEWPADWQFTALAPSLAQIIVPPEEPVIRYRPAIPLPAGVQTWVERVMTEDHPADAVARQVQYDKQTSTWGWPVAISRYVFEAHGGIVEERVGVFFRVLYNGAEVVVRGRDRARLAEVLPRVMELVLGAPVRWPDADTHTLHGLTREGPW